MTIYHSIIDFFWGDVPFHRQLIRTILKVFVVCSVALLVHEFLANGLTRVSSAEATAIQKSLAVANATLKEAALDKRFEGAKLQLCVIGVDASSESCPMEMPSGSRVLGFALVRQKPGGGGVVVIPNSLVEMFSVRRFLVVSTIHIKSSADSISRMIERVAFNSENVPVTELKLCAGTQKLLTGGYCRVTTEVQTELARAIDPLMQRLRVGSLFVGVVQWATLAVFIYGAFESFGLWLRWVAPAKKLYEVRPQGSGSRLEPVCDLVKEVEKYQQSSVHGLGDRLFLRTLLAANTNDPERKTPTNEETVSTLESYRVYLVDDASSRQESLEMLGDTMLKLAFLGTVFGISEALFAARGLDTADPFFKLSTKSEMYSGIGIGFGTTLVGIVLSILAALLRSNLSKAWDGRISEAYRLILDYSATELRLLAAQITAFPAVPPKIKNEWSAVDLFGSLIITLVLIGLCVYVLWSMLR